MVATFWLLSCALATAQSPTRPVLPPSPAAEAARGSDWVLTPRLVRGQELVYRGTFSEESAGARVQFQRTYRFETRYFVLDTPARRIDLAALTTLASGGLIEER